MGVRAYGMGRPFGRVQKGSATISTNWKRKALGFLSGERIVAHNLIVAGGTMLAGVLGVAFQSLISHQLKPGDYGSVFAVVTLVTSIGLPATAFTLLMARETSRGRAIGHQASSVALLRGGNQALLLGGLGLAALLSISAPALYGVLDVPPALVLAAAVGMPFGLALPLLIGELQGEERFAEYATIATGQAALKLAAAIGLGLILGPVGVIAGISVATFITYIVALRLVRRKLSIRSTLPWFRPAAAYLVVVLPSALALAVLVSSDVLMVKHYFSGQAAGTYAAVAAIGRAIFWGASGVAIVLFPKVAFRGAQGRSGIQIVVMSLLVVGLGGLLAMLVLSVGSAWLITAFAGSPYRAGASYLPWYAIGMILLGAAAVLIATYQSQGKARFLAVLLPLTALEPALISAFHHSLVQVVQTVDLSMGLLVVGLAAYYLIEERSRRHSSAAAQLDAQGIQVAPQLAVNR